MSFSAGPGRGDPELMQMAQLWPVAGPDFPSQRPSAKPLMSLSQFLLYHPHPVIRPAYCFVHVAFGVIFQNILRGPQRSGLESIQRPPEPLILSQNSTWTLSFLVCCLFPFPVSPTPDLMFWHLGWQVWLPHRAFMLMDFKEPPPCE